MQHGNFDKNLCFFFLFPYIPATKARYVPVLQGFGEPRGKSRAALIASSSELPAVPTSTRSEPVVMCWL